MFNKIVKHLFAPAVLSTALILSGSAGTLAMAAEPDQLQEDQENTGIVSCTEFSLTVPKEIADICDVIPSDNGISFYEKQAEDRYGGFVGSISAYQNEKDYASVPNFRRGGEIALSDGSRLDLVIDQQNFMRRVDPRINDTHHYDPYHYGSQVDPRNPEHRNNMLQHPPPSDQRKLHIRKRIDRKHRKNL